jgi:hypothetical protein
VGQLATGGEQTREGAGKSGLDETAFVMAFFRPGVGELDDDGLHAASGQGGKPGRHIVLEDADVLQFLIPHAHQQGPHPRTVDLGADAAPVGAAGGQGGQMFAVAKADLQRQGPPIAPRGSPGGCRVDPIARQEHLQ